MPGARQVVSRSPHRSVGIISCSWLQDEVIEYESQLERRFVYRALTFPLLKRISHQPFKIDYEIDGEQREYTPDFLVAFTDGSRAVIEVKPTKFLGKHQLKLDAGKRRLASEGLPFAVVTDDQIDKAGQSETAALIIRYTRGTISDRSRASCMAVISQRSGVISLGELIAKASVTESEVFHLIGRQNLAVPTLKHLGSDTLVLLPEQIQHENVPLFFFNWLDTTAW